VISLQHIPLRWRTRRNLGSAAIWHNLIWWQHSHPLLTQPRSAGSTQPCTDVWHTSHPTTNWCISTLWYMMRAGSLGCNKTCPRWDRMCHRGNTPGRVALISDREVESRAASMYKYVVFAYHQLCRRVVSEMCHSEIPSCVTLHHPGNCASPGNTICVKLVHSLGGCVFFAGKQG
jgi:hypothetical protein